MCRSNGGWDGDAGMDAKRQTITGRMPTAGDGVYDLVIEGARIVSVDRSTASADVCIGPALFDIQVNGYGGRTCKIRSEKRRGTLGYINRLMLENGVGWWIPTVCTGLPEVLETAFRTLGEILDGDPETAACIPGLHLEGPYLSGDDGPRGVHSKEAIRPADWDEFQCLQDVCGGRILYVTLAPETPGAIDFIRKATASGVICSLGHSNMTRDDLHRAVDAGARMSTHLGNGAHDMIQRHNNYLWYQLACRETYASFISDGQHLPEDCLTSMLRAKGLELSVITSDCVNLGGMPAGVYGYVEKLPNGRLVATGTPNLAGSSANLRECVECVVPLGHVSHAEAWRLASLQAARAMKLEDRLGLAPGKEATFTVYTVADEGREIRVQQTWVAGKKRFDADTTERVVLETEDIDEVVD